MTLIDESLRGLLDLEFGTIPDMLRLNAKRMPRQVALRLDAQSMTYAELDQLTDTIAAKLQQEGVGVGDAIAICAPTSLSYVAIFIGGLKAGAAVAPLSFAYGPDALAGMVSDAE